MGQKVHCKLPKNTDKMNTPSDNFQKTKKCSDDFVQRGQGSRIGFPARGPECLPDSDQSQWSATECVAPPWTRASACDRQFIIQKQAGHLTIENGEINEDAVTDRKSTCTTAGTIQEK